MPDIIVSAPERCSTTGFKGHIIIDDKFIPYQFTEYFLQGYFEVRFSKNGMELNYQRPISSKEVRELVEQAAIYLFNEKR
jgi:hypothetical protein